MAKAPLEIVKEKFTDKAGLVKAVRALATDDLWIDREGQGLDHAPNAKLLHLHEVLTEVKAKYKTRSALIDAIVAADGKAKDKDYRNRFESWPVPRLYDYVRAAEKRSN